MRENDYELHFFVTNGGFQEFSVTEIEIQRGGGESMPCSFASGKRRFRMSSE